MSTAADSVVDRVERVKHCFEREDGPDSLRAVVDGPCPSCGGLDVVEVRAATTSFSCDRCGAEHAA